MSFEQSVINHFSGGYDIQIPVLTFPFTNPEISIYHKFVALPVSQGIRILVKDVEKTGIVTENGDRVTIDSKSSLSHKWFDPFIIMERISQQRGWKKRPELFMKIHHSPNDNLSMEYSMALGAIYSYSLVNNIILSMAEMEQLSYEIMSQLKYDFKRFKVKALLYGRYSEAIVGDDEHIKSEIVNLQNYSLYFIGINSAETNEKYLNFTRNFKTITSRIRSNNNLKFPYSGYKSFYESEEAVFKKMSVAIEQGDMEDLGKAAYDCSIGLRDNLHVTSNFQNELSRLLDAGKIDNYYFTVGPGNGGIIGIWDNYNFENFSSRIIKDYFLEKGIPLNTKKLEPSTGIWITKIPII